MSSTWNKTKDNAEYYKNRAESKLEEAGYAYNNHRERIEDAIKYDKDQIRKATGGETFW